MNLRYAFALLLFFSLKPLMADHLPGGSLTYKCNGGNMYELKLSLLRACSGFQMVPQTLHLTNSCGVVFDVANIPPVEVPISDQICEADSANSLCSGGAMIGFELYEFVTTQFLSPCDYWTVSWSICCRPPTVNVQSIPGIYIETTIYNVTDSCNNSPVFNHNGVPRVCVGQVVNFDASATDPDGTRLEYQFIDARYASPSPVSVNYVFPNYGGEPIAGMTLDQGTGQVTFTPPQEGYVVVAVQVNEYNSANGLIGSVMRDFPFLVETCSNQAPTADSGSINATSGGVTISGPRALNLCSGNPGCATIEFTDPDAGGTLSIWTNVDAILPGSTVEVSGTDPLNVNLCWDEVPASTGADFFVITVMDDACSIRGARSYVYTLQISAAPYAGLDGSAISCELAQPINMLDSLQGEPPAGGQWTDPLGAAHSEYFLGNLDQPGTYTYTITEGTCAGTAELLVDLLSVEDSLCIFLEVPEHALEMIDIYPNPTTGIIT
ncbi:MAG: hypothetical protein M3R08_10215, partial [Bacteroidota bacterium]|nr:hypothetical protein [Bacteroidota bacterium]